MLDAKYKALLDQEKTLRLALEQSPVELKNIRLWANEVMDLLEMPADPVQHIIGGPPPPPSAGGPPPPPSAGGPPVPNGPNQAPVVQLDPQELQSSLEHVEMLKDLISLCQRFSDQKNSHQDFPYLNRDMGRIQEKLKKQRTLSFSKLNDWYTGCRFESLNKHSIEQRAWSVVFLNNLEALTLEDKTQLSALRQSAQHRILALLQSQNPENKAFSQYMNALKKDLVKFKNSTNGLQIVHDKIIGFEDVPDEQEQLNKWKKSARFNTLAGHGQTLKANLSKLKEEYKTALEALKDKTDNDKDQALKELNDLEVTFNATKSQMSKQLEKLTQLPGSSKNSKGGPKKDYSEFNLSRCRRKLTQFKNFQNAQIKLYESKVHHFEKEIEALKAQNKSSMGILNDPVLGQIPDCVAQTNQSIKAIKLDITNKQKELEAFKLSSFPKQFKTIQEGNFAHRKKKYSICNLSFTKGFHIMEVLLKAYKEDLARAEYIFNLFNPKEITLPEIKDESIKPKKVKETRDMAGLGKHSDDPKFNDPNFDEKVKRNLVPNLNSNSIYIDLDFLSISERYNLVNFLTNSIDELKEFLPFKDNKDYGWQKLNKLIRGKLELNETITFATIYAVAKGVLKRPEGITDPDNHKSFDIDASYIVEQDNQTTLEEILKQAKEEGLFRQKSYQNDLSEQFKQEKVLEDQKKKLEQEQLAQEEAETKRLANELKAKHLQEKEAFYLSLNPNMPKATLNQLLKEAEELYVYKLNSGGVDINELRAKVKAKALDAQNELDPKAYQQKEAELIQAHRQLDEAKIQALNNKKKLLSENYKHLSPEERGLLDHIEKQLTETKAHHAHIKHEELENKETSDWKAWQEEKEALLQERADTYKKLKRLLEIKDNKENLKDEKEKIEAQKPTMEDLANKVAELKIENKKLTHEVFETKATNLEAAQAHIAKKTPEGLAKKGDFKEAYRLYKILKKVPEGANEDRFGFMAYLRAHAAGTAAMKAARSAALS